tara:strand:+ start:1755 stop:2426 length:672 start_codon:yes stop_codon:yes gene_type:complete
MQKELNSNINLLRLKLESVVGSNSQSLNEVTTIAVSKKKSLDHINIAFECGINNFGENYAQELEEKFLNIKNEDIIWHFIGPIQSNKIKIISRCADWVHSLDRESVVEKLNKECGNLGKVINGFIQVNVSEEETKSGIKASNLLEFAKLLETMENINLKGIMVLPKIGSKDEMIKSKELHDELIAVYPSAKYLSMGTTSDFELAISIGSNMIRVGELIFGERL